MKKTNARRIIALVLALMLALPVVSIPAMAETVTQSAASSGKPVKAPGALYLQDFEAFYTLSGPVVPGSGVLKGPSSARVLQTAEGNVLQIDCKAGAPDGKYWLNFEYPGAVVNNNYIEILEPITQKTYNHPAGELGENVSGFNGDGSAQPTIFTTYGEVIVGGTVKMPSEEVYAIKGVVNEKDRIFTCKLYYLDQYENKYEFEYEYEYEYEVAYDYAYEYEYAYKTEMAYDKNGNLVVKKDENGNIVYVLDEYGHKIPILDENGDPTYAKDENGNLIRKKDAYGNDVVLVDETGEMVINRYVYEYNADGSVKLDGQGNPVIATDAKGNKLASPDGEGDLVVLRDANGDPIPLYYPDGTIVPKLDEDGNKVIKVDDEGNPVYSTKPRLDAFGYPVPKGGYKNYILDPDGKTEPLLDANGEKMLLEIPLGKVNYQTMDVEEFEEWRDLFDENGEPVMKDIEKPVLDANGKPVLDADGNPVTEFVWQDKYFDVLDENGDPVMVKVIEKVEQDGQFIEVEKWVKKQETRLETQIDDQGNPVIKTEFNPAAIIFQRDEFGDEIYFDSKFSVAPQNFFLPLYLKTEWSEVVTRELTAYYLDEAKTQVSYRITDWFDVLEDGSKVYYTSEDKTYIAYAVTAFSDVVEREITVYYTDATKTHYSYDTTGGSKMPKMVPNVVYTWKEKTDANGKVLRDKYNHPIYECIKDEGPGLVPDRELIVEEYKVKIMEHAQEQARYLYQWTVETPNPTLTSIYIFDSQVRDSFGGYSNIAKPAYLQSGALSDDVLLFSTDYYFSADDPATPDINEALSHGFDVRISVNDKNGVKKDFDFIHAANPKDGYITLEAHTDAPMTIVSGSVDVPLGSWCNIMIAADFTAATYAVYVNGELICVRQNTVLGETSLTRDVIINTQTAATTQKLDANGNTILVEQKDENGNVIMIPRKDANGNYITSEKVDENGNYVYDRDGNHVLDYEMTPAMVPDIERWPDGTPKYTYLDTAPTSTSILMEVRDADGNIVLDENGDPVKKPVQTMDLMRDVVDENGDYVVDFVRDKNGNIRTILLRDENGDLILDAEENLIYIPLMKIAQENVTEVKMSQKIDTLGRPVFEEREVDVIDPETGKVVMVEQKDKDGNVMYDDNGKPIMIPLKTIEVDEEGNPIQYPVMIKTTEKYSVYGPTTAEWNVAGDNLINGSWNLGYFVRGSNVDSYTGYMQIDNVAVYAGKDIEQFFAYKGYSIDFSETFDQYAVGDKIPFDLDTATATAAEKDGHTVLKVNFSDYGNANAVFTPEHMGFSYLSSQKVVLEGNYFLSSDAVGMIQSQFKSIGAFIKGEGAFGGTNHNGEDKKINLKSREYTNVNLYGIQASAGKAYVIFNGPDGALKAAVPTNQWSVISTVLDLETGKMDIYINGILGISTQLGQQLTYVAADKSTVTNEWNSFTNISVGPESWSALKIITSSAGKSSFYVDDLTVTTMGVGAQLKTIDGLISADVYANGSKVSTVTDTNVFFTSKKVTLENVKTYNLGTDQLLKTDDTTFRFTAPAGIRFASLLDLDALNALYDKVYRPQKPGDAESNGQEDALRAVSFGTLIIPTDLLKGRDLTFDTLEEYDLPYLDVQGHEGSYYDLDGKEGTTHIVGSIIDIKEENINRLFSAVNYGCSILENGIVYNIYSDRVVITSAQSLADDAYGEYTAAEQEILDAYFAGKKPTTD